jgi:hypothetical protein
VSATQAEPKSKPDPRDEPNKLIEALEIFYDVRDGSYLTLLNGRYINMKINDLKMRFRAMGLRKNQARQSARNSFPISQGAGRTDD